MPDTVSTLPSRAQILAWAASQLEYNLPAECELASVHMSPPVLAVDFQMQYGLRAKTDAKVFSIVVGLFPDSEVSADESCESRVRQAATHLAMDILAAAKT